MERICENCKWCKKMLGAVMVCTKRGSIGDSGKVWMEVHPKQKGCDLWKEREEEVVKLWFLGNRV